MIKQSFLAIDAIAQRDNTLTRLDARFKVFLSVVLLGAVTAFPGVIFPTGILLAAVMAVLFIKTPFHVVVGRLIPPLVLGIGFMILMMFTQGQTGIFSIHVAGLELHAYKEGILAGFTLLARLLSSVSILLFLSVTTPIYELGWALVWFKIPATVVELLLLTYRYLFVLWDEGMRIREAQTLRLGYPKWNNPGSWKLATKSTFTLMGMVIIRAYDRAESTFSAMQLRGYNGSVMTAKKSYSSY